MNLHMVECQYSQSWPFSVEMPTGSRIREHTKAEESDVAQLEWRSIYFEDLADLIHGGILLSPLWRRRYRAMGSVCRAIELEHKISSIPYSFGVGRASRKWSLWEGIWMRRDGWIQVESHNQSAEARMTD